MLVEKLQGVVERWKSELKLMVFIEGMEM